MSGEEWKWQKALVATGGGAITGAAAPLVLAGLSSGTLTLGSLSAVGNTGAVALVSTEVSGFVGALSYEANQLVDGKPFTAQTLRQAGIEFAYSAPFGLVRPASFGGRLLKDVFKRRLRDYLFPTPLGTDDVLSTTFSRPPSKENKINVD
jgi:hypothetical protein